MALSLGATTLAALYLGSTAISTAYLGSVQVYDAGGAFTPASLFASGEQGAWYEPSTTTCFTDTAGTIPATVGDAVARINDLSGNGNHATQATAAARPILRQTAGGLYYLERDGVDDHLTIPAIFTGTEDVTYIEAYDPDGLNWMLLSREGSFLNWLGIGQSGSTSTALVDGATLSSIRFDGVTDATGTRGGLYTASQAANVVTLQATLSSANWNNPMTWSQYANGSTFDSIGSKSFGFLFVNRDVTTEERANLETYFGNRAGITL